MSQQLSIPEAFWNTIPADAQAALLAAWKAMEDQIAELEATVRDLQGRLQLNSTTFMSDRLIGWTLPAHDPNFPKPRGLLPVPPRLADLVARDEAECIRKHGTGYSPEARQRILDENVLYWYYDGSYVAHRRTPQGVEVLAVGWEEAHKYLEEHPDATLEGVVIGTV